VVATLPLLSASRQPATLFTRTGEAPLDAPTRAALGVEPGDTVRCAPLHRGWHPAGEPR
jgi:arginine N-succinyltransferase